MRGRKPHSDELKHEVVKLVREQGLPRRQVATDLGIDLDTLRRWLDDAPTRAGWPPGSAPSSAEVVRLRRENEQLRMERDILKKSTRHLLADARMTQKYQFVAAHASPYPVVVICRVLGLARSGSYAWHARTPSAQQQDARLTTQITRIFTASRRTYGSPRVHAELRATGVRCARKRVARLMRHAQLVARTRRRHVRTTDS